MQGTTRRADAAFSNRILTFARRHPRLTIYAAIALLFLLWMVWFTVDQRRQDAAQEAFDRSPAGRAKAAAEQQRISDDVDISVAKAMVQAQLRDPESAQFMGVQLVRRGSDKGVCGYVNARNGFGGMAGSVAFAVIDMQAIMANDAYPKDLKRLDRLCYGR